MAALRDRYCRAPETRASCDGSLYSASSACTESAPRFRSAACPAFTHASPVPTWRERAETARNCPRAARASAHTPTARLSRQTSQRAAAAGGEAEAGGNAQQ